MKYLLLLIFTSFLFFSVHAKNYAIESCLNSTAFLQYCKNNDVHILSKLQEHNFYIVSCDNEQKLHHFCFYSEVKNYQNNYMFNTNSILIKAKYRLPNSVIDSWQLEAHSFIPNLYIMNNAGATETAVNATLKQVSQQKWCKLAEVNQVFTLTVTSNDPIFYRQWSIANDGTAVQYNGTVDADMDVDSAWTLSTGDVSIKIAVLDSGVDTLHEDLQANILSGYDAFSSDTSDTKGYPTPNYSSDGHGTACAGIVAAVADNNLGIAGVANSCKIVPIRIFYYQDYGSSIGVQASTSTSALLNGSAYAWRVADADVMSVSAGLLPLFIAYLNINTQIVNEEISEAYSQGRNGYGVPMFFSSGNEEDDDVLWPADLYHTIAVGASTMCDERKNPNDCSTETWGSSYGVNLDVVAPGVKIATTDMTGANGYSNGAYITDFNGTSAACPNAAGVGALILSVNPILHARDVKAIINSSADKVTGYNYDSTTVYGTWNEEVGHGRVNAFEAVKMAVNYQSTVGVSSLSSDFNVEIYPNPSKGSFVVKNNNKEAQEFLVYNLLGVLIQQINVPADNELKVNLPSNNVYIIKAKKGNYTEKVVVY